MDGNENDNTDTSRKRKQVGVIAVERFAKIKEWQQYSQASKAFAVAKAASATAKSAFREVLMQRAPHLKNVDGEIDFLVAQDGESISIHEVVKGTRRQKEKSELEFK